MIIATGRSDYPNQVNNVLGFPVHLPRSARCSRHRHQRRDEAGRHARAWPISPRKMFPIPFAAPTVCRGCSLAANI